MPQATRRWISEKVKSRDSSLISTSVRMVQPQRTSDEKRPGRGRQRINPREFATTGPRTPETAANYLLHRGLRQAGSGDQRGVSRKHSSYFRPTANRLGPGRQQGSIARCRVRWPLGEAGQPVGFGDAPSGVEEQGQQQIGRAGAVCRQRKLRSSSRECPCQPELWAAWTGAVRVSSCGPFSSSDVSREVLWTRLH